ncbi:ADP-ribosylglycohydrolase family protein [bacterium]|nr:ADP-ribosylglycohydrolase family protein [bacterium]
MKLYKIILSGLLILMLAVCQTSPSDTFTLSKDKLKDKIKGAWAAQTIGVTFGSPVEFKYKSTMIPDSVKLEWNAGILENIYENIPGVYDDIYMDLTFVQVFEDQGLDAPADAFAEAFANAEYPLWFANQTARRNILDGLKAPESGHWLNNPCADDIDFQIEADFAGIMSPGMVNSATRICDKIGHIMNYGDGYYGGVFIAAMYSQAFVSDNIHDVVNEALKVIPPESSFAQTMLDVIRWHKQNPQNWKDTWLKVHQKWSDEIGSAVGVFDPFNIDAKINAAWVLMGLLYGEGDFTRTFEIATRCGDDADCNPASAGGILGALKGYDAIPEYWKQGLATVEPIDFKYTTISLDDAYDLSFKHALEVITKNGGQVDNDKVTIKTQQPETLALEVAFEGHYPTGKPKIDEILKENFSYSFDGKGFVIRGKAQKKGSADYVFKVQMSIDGRLIETATLPTNFVQRRFYLFWHYQLSDAPHEIKLKVLNPSDQAEIYLQEILIYGSEPQSFRD